MTIARRAAAYAALCTALAVVATALIAALPGTPAWAATPGGVTSRTPEATTPTYPTDTESTVPASRAMLVNGRAVAPLAAPPAVRRVIAAANRIRSKPYIWGGGHGRWWDRGYDCSGAVSFALHGGALLDGPLPSGPLMTWEKPGLGRWITVFANSGHTYAVIAGLRWDTSGTGGNGPRWHEEMRSRKGFVARHPAGY